MAVGGNWPGNPDGTSVFPDTMFVDYVRVYQVTTGFSKSQSNAISATVFPNPADGNSQLQLNATTSGMYTIKIINVCGLLVGQQQAAVVKDQTMELSLDTEQLAAGLYHIWIEGNGFNYALKLACVH